MVFRFFNTGGNHCCQWISADGPITTKTPDDFRKFMKEQRYGADVLLNSPGGSLSAGIELGQLFRQYNLSTRVGRIMIDKYGPNEIGGECASTCAYAFIGGIERQIPKGSRLGFHRFYNKNAITSFDKQQFSAQYLDNTQRTVAALVSYIQVMGLDAAVINLADKAGPNEMYWVSDSEARTLKIIFALNSWAPWVIEPYKNGILTYSKLDNGVAQMTLFCTRREGLQLIFTADNLSLNDMNNMKKCKSFDGHMIYFGVNVSPNDIFTGVTAERKPFLKVLLPVNGNFQTSQIFDNANYSRACSLGSITNNANFIQSIRAVARTCID